MKQGFGLIQVYTGDGKGKTTAALGLAVRAWGWGRKVAIVYFDKGGSHYGERKALDKLGIPYHVFGLDRIDSSGKFRFGVLPEDKKEAAKALQQVKEYFLAANLDLLILDEINVALNLGLAPLQKLLNVLKYKPSKMEVVLTGRGCPEQIMTVADLVTEMKLHKHYFYKGVSARRGIEY